MPWAHDQMKVKVVKDEGPIVDIIWNFWRFEPMFNE